VPANTHRLRRWWGAIRGVDPSRNFEILHLSISGRPFTAQGTPAP